MAQANTNLSTSFSLIQRVRAMQPDAWHILSRLYGPLVYRWARQCGLQSQDAADVTQNVFVSIQRGILRFKLDRENSTFRGWIWKITRNAVREFARKRNQHPAAFGGSDAQLAMQLLADVDHQESENSGDSVEPHLIHRALGIVRESVEAHNWEAFWRTTALSEPAVEVAQALRMTPTAVRQAKYRVLCRLRDLLANE